MHELSIAQNMVELIEEAARGRRVRRVRLEVGALAGVLPEALVFCFDMATEDTLLSGAALEILNVPGIARCQDCNEVFPIDSYLATCACGSCRLTYLNGQELNIKSVDVEEQAVSDA